MIQPELCGEGEPLAGGLECAQDFVQALARAIRGCCAPRVRRAAALWPSGCETTGVASVVGGKEPIVWDIEVILDPIMAPNTLSARVEGEMLQIRVAPGVKAMTLAVLHEPIAAAVAEAIDEEMTE